MAGKAVGIEEKRNVADWKEYKTLAELKATIAMTIESEKSYRIFYSAGNPNNRLIHVRAIVDDQYVIRWWRRRKQCWQYAVEDHYYFYLLIEHGHIEESNNG